MSATFFKRLLFLFAVQRVPAQTGAVLLDLQFLTARLAFERVVVIAALVTNEENRFGFLFAFGHRWTLELDEFGSFRLVEGRELLHDKGDFGK